MKNWCTAIVLYCAVRAILDLFFGKKENAAVSNALKLFLSLGLILLILYPAVSLIRKDVSFSLLVPETTLHLQDRFENVLASDLQNKFPNENVALSVKWREDQTPDTIVVTCTNESTKQAVADYILLRYQIRCETESEGSP